MRTLFCSSLVLLLAACSGEAAPPGSQLAGSYELTFHGVAKTGETGPSVSEGASARVDLREVSGAFQAIVTPRWGMPSAFAVDLSSGSAVLTGSALVGAPGGADGEQDTWTSITLALAADGGLSGSVQATGTWSALSGDEGVSGAATSGGSIVPATRAPELASVLTSPAGPADAMLPWDPVQVSIAEGVSASALAKALSVTTVAQEVSTPVAVGWKLGPTSPDVAWGGVVTATGRVQSWDAVVGAPASLAVKAGVRDLAGNASAAYSAAFSFLGMPGPAASDGFDSAAAEVGSWGGAVFLGGATGSDPACEQGGCVQLGPFETFSCTSSSRLGIAGRLTTPSTSSALQARYRVLIADTGSTGVAPLGGVTAFTLEIATPGATPTSTSVAVQGPYQDLGASASLRWTTPWMTATASLPASHASEVGYAVYAAAGSQDCPGLEADQTIAVLVDSVSIQ